MRINDKLLLDLGFEKVKKDPLVKWLKYLGDTVAIEWSLSPVNGSFNLVLPDDTRVTLNIRDENDIIQLGLLFSNSTVETDTHLYYPRKPEEMEEDNRDLN